MHAQLPSVNQTPVAAQPWLQAHGSTRAEGTGTGSFMRKTGALAGCNPSQAVPASLPLISPRGDGFTWVQLVVVQDKKQTDNRAKETDKADDDGLTNFADGEEGTGFGLAAHNSLPFETLPLSRLA